MHHEHVGTGHPGNISLGRFPDRVGAFLPVAPGVVGVPMVAVGASVVTWLWTGANTDLGEPGPQVDRRSTRACSAPAARNRMASTPSTWYPSKKSGQTKSRG
jgi:hypothetical protein